MAVDKSSKPIKKNRNQAAALNKSGLKHYAEWEIDQAIAAFQAASEADPDNPEYYLNLARAHARGDNYPEAMRALGHYLRTETDEDLASRYERLFSSALDEVEESLIEGMRRLETPIQLIGKAIQMWLEYRITVGRRPLRIPKPQLWAGALALAVARINFFELSREQVATAFDIPDRSLKSKYEELVDTLDLMPADYRYFIGDENPLDKLVEAAHVLDNMYRKFKEE